MARPTGWDILGLDADPTPGVVESVQALAKQFGDFAHDVEAAYRSLNSFGSDTAAMQWVGQTAEAFKAKYGPLPGRLQKLYTSYSEASDALSAYAPLLQAAQTKADSALRQAQDANADLQRATTNATNAAADLKTAQKNQAANPNQQAVTDAQTAHTAAQTDLDSAKARMADLTKQANDAYNDRINAAKACAGSLHHAQSDGIHNKPWWEHVGAVLSEWGGEIGRDRRRARAGPGHHRAGHVLDPRCGRGDGRSGRGRQHRGARRNRRGHRRRCHAGPLGRRAARCRHARPDLRRRPGPGLGRRGARGRGRGS